MNEPTTVYPTLGALIRASTRKAVALYFRPITLAFQLVYRASQWMTMVLDQLVYRASQWMTMVLDQRRALAAQRQAEAEERRAQARAETEERQARKRRQTKEEWLAERQIRQPNTAT